MSRVPYRPYVVISKNDIILNKYNKIYIPRIFPNLWTKLKKNQNVNEYFNQNTGCPLENMFSVFFVHFFERFGINLGIKCLIFVFYVAT